MIELADIREPEYVNWQPTGQLKFVRVQTFQWDAATNTTRMSTAPILQQEWREGFSGETEWRTVPEEEA